MCNDLDKHWSQSKLGTTIKGLQDDGVVEVWASPLNVLETMICAQFDEKNRIIDTTQLDKRVRLAQCLVDLTQCQRMLQSYEYQVVSDLLSILTVVAPDVVRTLSLVQSQKEASRRDFIGTLAMLAACRSFDCPLAVDSILRTKLTSQLIQSRFALDPEKFVDSIVTAAQQFRLTDEDIWAELDSRSIAELRAEIAANKSIAVRMTKQGQQKLQQHKDLVATTYTVPEIGQSLASVFAMDHVLLLTLDGRKLRSHWDVIHAPCRIPTPNWLNEVTDDELETDAGLVARTLMLIVRNISRTHFLSGRIPDAVALGELEMCLKKGEVPTAGLCFDCQHVVALTEVDLFMSSDTRLLTLANRAKKIVETETPHRVEVVSDAERLLRVAKV